MRLCHSRKGAWIEIALRKELDNDPAVAPVRERGLKSAHGALLFQHVFRRSRKGAWIEISVNSSIPATLAGRSRKGAWIEISACLQRW